MKMVFKKIAKHYDFEGLGTTWSTEIASGFAVFMSLSYIFILNPSILSETGIPSGAVFFATILASGLATLAMGVFARLPFALAPGLESNGFFTFVVVGSLGFTWQEGLGLVFWSGVLCLLLTIIPARQKIINSIPDGLKAAIAATVGVFVAVIGLVVTDLVKIEDGLPSQFGNLFSPKSLLLLTGFVISLVLGNKKLKFPAAMLVAIIVSAILSKIIGVPPETPSAKKEEFFAAVLKFDLFGVFRDPRAWTVLLVFFMIDFYGSIGKFIGLTRKTNLQTNGKVHNMKGALFVDSSGTIFGSALGTSTLITYVESAVGISQGGRSGVVAIVCGLLMLIGLAFSPLVGLIPVAAVSGVLFYVGILLLPIDELKDALKGESNGSGSLDIFDFLVIIVMSLVAGFTFSLDKSMFIGFLIYTVKGVVKTKKANVWLLGSTIVLGIAMAFQYFGMK